MKGRGSEAPPVVRREYKHKLQNELREAKRYINRIGTVVMIAVPVAIVANLI
jgi:hypothetical protein